MSRQLEQRTATPVVADASAIIPRGERALTRHNRAALVPRRLGGPSGHAPFVPRLPNIGPAGLVAIALAGLAILAGLAALAYLIATLIVWLVVGAGIFAAAFLLSHVRPEVGSDSDCGRPC